jgi:hypothetical protein
MELLERGAFLKSNPAGLTARELEVLGLLGVRSRRDAARVATARGIVGQTQYGEPATPT